MLFFRSEDLVDAWCQTRGIERRPLVTIPQLSVEAESPAAVRSGEALVSLKQAQPGPARAVNRLQSI
jgi:hypothetical protein